MVGNKKKKGGTGGPNNQQSGKKPVDNTPSKERTLSPSPSPSPEPEPAAPPAEPAERAHDKPKPKRVAVMEDYGDGAPDDYSTYSANRAAQE